MASEKEIVDELDFLTDRLSTQVRTTALGALAFSWGMLIGNSEVTKNLTAQLKWHLVGVCALSVLTMFLDFAQYCAGYKGTRAVQRAAERAENHQAEWDENSLYFRLRVFFFGAKMATLSATVFWLLGALAYWLVTSYSQ